MKLKKVGLFLLVLILIAIPVLGANGDANSSSNNAKQEDKVAAIVNGDKITVNQVDQEINLNGLISKLFQVDQQFVQLIFQTDEGTKLLNDYRKAKLDNVIVKKLLVDKAKAENITVSDKEKDDLFNQQIANIKKQNNINDDQLLQALKQQGIDSLDQFKKTFVSQNQDAMLINKLQQKVVGPVKVTDQEIKDYYNKNKDSFTTKEQVKASHILVKDKDTAEEILKKLKDGANFADLAKKYSIDTASAKNGGDLGSFSKGQMVKPFEEAAFALKVGEISDIVKTDYGYHIIKVTGKTPASTKSFDDVKSQIKNKLMNQKKSDTMNKYIKSLRTAADVQIKL